MKEIKKYISRFLSDTGVVSAAATDGSHESFEFLPKAFYLPKYFSCT